MFSLWFIFAFKSTEDTPGYYGVTTLLFCILALPYLVLRTSSRPVVHMREFNVQSSGVNAILLSRILHFRLLLGYFVLFAFPLLYNMFYLLYFIENIIEADFKPTILLNNYFNDFK